MGFPALDIPLSNKPVALIIDQDGNMSAHKIKKIKGAGGMFRVDGLGYFKSDPSKGVNFDKQRVFLYDVRNTAHALDVRALKEIDSFCDKNGLVTLTRRDVRHSALLRSLMKAGKKKEEAIKEIEEQEEDAKKKITDEIDKTNRSLMQVNEENIKKGEKPLDIDPDEYSSYIIEQLIYKKLVTKEEAEDIQKELMSGTLTLEDFIKKLEELRALKIHEPITPHAEKFLESYKAYNGNNIDTFIDRAEQIGKKIQTMGSPKVANAMPVTFIATFALIAIIVGAVFSGLDFTNLQNALPIPSLTGGFIKILGVFNLG